MVEILAGVWIIMIMGLMVTLHMIKVSLRRWACKNLNSDNIAFIAREKPNGYQ